MKKLDMGRLKSRVAKTVSTEEALKDISPMEWSDDVINGNRKITITSGSPADNSNTDFAVHIRQ